MTSRSAFRFIAAAALVLPACTETPAAPNGATRGAGGAPSADAGGPYHFDAPVFDIEATPDGSILVGAFTTIREIRGGTIQDVIDIPSLPGTWVQGIAAVGRRSFFVSNAALDQAAGAAVWHVSQGRVRLVGDIQTFERQHDPDARVGPQWKDVRCEEDPTQGFTAGPQSNPYHLTMLTGSTAALADAAGNTVLAVRNSGAVELIAVLTPPQDEAGDWRVLFTLDDATDCYVQPVPTSVAVGPYGALYVGELTGVPAVPGWSRIWRIDAGARGVVCPSAACREVISGLTSIIDLEFGPDGMLYVIEMDSNGWLAAIIGNPAGGTIRRCDVATGDCVLLKDGLTLPGALTFDRRGGLWVLENGIAAPVVRRLDSAF